MSLPSSNISLSSSTAFNLLNSPNTPIDSIQTSSSLSKSNNNKTPTRSILKSSSQTTTSMVSDSNNNNNTQPHHHHLDTFYIDKTKQILLDEQKLNEIRKDVLQLSKQSASTGSAVSGISIGPHHTYHNRDEIIIGANLSEKSTNNTCGTILIGLSWFLMAIFFPFSLFMTLKVVQEYERAVIFRLGRLSAGGGSKGPGLFIVLPCVESYTKVDMRTVSFDVPPQEVLTKDSVTVAVDAVVYYRVFNPVISIANVENAQESTRLLAQTSLRNVLGTISLAEILSNRESVSSCMREILDEATDRWGIKVERVEIKDVRLPIQLQRAMAAEAEATREAKAKVIAAEGEHKAAGALKDAADILSQSSQAIQLRYLQTLNNIAGEKNSTIVFPLPIEILKSFIDFSDSSNQENNTSSSPVTSSPFNSNISRYAKRHLRIKPKEILSSDSSNNDSKLLYTKIDSNKNKEQILINVPKSSYDITDL